MGTPQIIMIVIMALGIGIELVQHGKTTEQKHNFWVTLIANVIQFAILKWGGFF